MKLSNREKIVLADIERWSRHGYPINWTPKTREALVQKGLAIESGLRVYLSGSGHALLEQLESAK